MAFEKRTAIVSIAALVMIVAMTMSEVEARLSVGRNLLEATSERRYLTDIVGKVVGKHCCNKVITKCCAPPPKPTPTRKLAAKTTAGSASGSTSGSTSGSASGSTSGPVPSTSKSGKSRDGKTTPKIQDDNKSMNRAKPPTSAPSKSKSTFSKSRSASPKSKSASPKSKAAQAPKAMHNNKKTAVQRN